MEFEWNLPVKDSVLDDKGYRINDRAKLHCFVKSVSLCGRYQMAPGMFETSNLGEADIVTHPEYFCKKCTSKYKKIMEGRVE